MTTSTKALSFARHDRFADRHIGPGGADVAHMLDVIGVDSVETLVRQAVPLSILQPKPIQASGEARTEMEALAELRELAEKNRVGRSFLGGGYHRAILPPVIQRNVLENPGWYTQYTPYQAEIAQGRLEAMLNFQTIVAELTGLPIAGASLLDEATAAAEAMAMCYAAARKKRPAFFVADDAHLNTLSVLRTRAESLGIELVIADRAAVAELDETYCGALLSYPNRFGVVASLADDIAAIHAVGALAVVSADLLALTLLREPGADGADICVGSTQRFGMPLGFGGPHAGFLSTTPKCQRQMPGRIVGISVDREGNAAYRLALQTREQHIRREKATSNICTAQVLPAVVASMYAVYHGAEGLTAIAERVRALAGWLAQALEQGGRTLVPGDRFDTIAVELDEAEAIEIVATADAQGILVRAEGGRVVIALDEATEPVDVADLAALFGATPSDGSTFVVPELGAQLVRGTEFLNHEVFRAHRTEHEMLRYLQRLQTRDLSLTTSMIPLGSCTMKLNATAQMMPISWPQWAGVHPHAPESCWRGYAELFAQLGGWLAALTGMAETSLQPNSGAQGEYAGLLAIRAYHASRGEAHRTVCLIPTSAHGTNPASAVIAGFRVIPVKCDADGNIDVEDLRAKAEKHAEVLGALMITYPSTHGVFEEPVREVCEIVHAHGGQVYMDGANMNAQVGLCSPGDIGADVCHLNLHKTFCIPHGGGGPGMGPICVKPHLAPFLPGEPNSTDGGVAVSGARFGSALILVIPWMYIRMMSDAGLRKATETAILNANYMACRLSGAYDVVYTGIGGRVAHEFIIDFRSFKKTARVEVEDIAKRLMDYGFHSPTMSFPVAGTLMIEPTESESRGELDRFCDAMLSIREEIAAIERGERSDEDNALKHAPHTASVATGDAWAHEYSRAQAAFPLPWVRANKFWPSVSRIDNGFGDRNLICTCPPMEDLIAEGDADQGGAKDAAE